MVFNVQILGSNSALAAHGRHPTSQVIYANQELFLIDCGEGTQMRMSAFHVKRSRINHIFISHLHGDHYFGLIGLLTSYHLMGRTAPLTIFGPAPLEQIIQLQLDAANTVLRYPLHFRRLQADRPEEVLHTACVTVTSFPLRHRIPTTGFLFEEKPGKRKIDGSKADGLGLSPEQYDDLREGRDITLRDGRTIPCGELTFPAPPSRRYAYCSDTVFMPELREVLSSVDMLYHEATFLAAESEKAGQTFHSTTSDAAEMARLLGARKLLVGHFSSRYVNLDEYLAECRDIFPETSLAVEGNIYEVPREGTMH